MDQQFKDKSSLQKEKKMLCNSFNVMLIIYDVYTKENFEFSDLREDFLTVKEQMKQTKTRDFGQKHMQNLLTAKTGKLFRVTFIDFLQSQYYQDAIKKNRSLKGQRKEQYLSIVNQLYIYELKNDQAYFKKFANDENAKKLLPDQQEQSPVQEEIVQFVSGEDEFINNEQESNNSNSFQPEANSLAGDYIKFLSNNDILLKQIH